MRAKRTQRAIVKTGSNAAEGDMHRTRDLLAISGDVLCNRAYEALLDLPLEQRDLVRDQILLGLQKSGVNIGGCLLLLGIPATKPDELSPLEIAKLLRFIRINRPDALELIAVPLAGLVYQKQEPQKSRAVPEAA